MNYCILCGRFVASNHHECDRRAEKPTVKLCDHAGGPCAACGGTDSREVTA